MKGTTGNEGRPPRPVAILGAGNLLAGDDGVGVHAVRDWPEDLPLPGGVRLLDAGTLGPDTLAYLEPGEAVVLLDAVRGDGTPGTIYRADLGQVEAEEPVPLSVHDLGIGVLLREARLLGRPLCGVLLGVEPARVDAGTTLSPPLRAALPRLRQAALREAQRLRRP
jgi:hydrogenase maturation protease